MSENTQPTSSNPQPESFKWLLWPVIAAVMVLTLFSLTQPAPTMATRRSGRMEKEAEGMAVTVTVTVTDGRQ